MRVIHIDIETFSEMDLSVGAYEYFRHPSTKLLCACWQIGEEIDGQFKPDIIETWREGDGDPINLIEAMKAGVTVYAHNAEFEREGINHLTNWCKLPVEQMKCTLALAACQSLPLALDKLGMCLDIERKKDADGKKLMLSLCKPDKNGVNPVATKEQMDKLVAYCVRDVEAEIDIGQALMPYTDIQLSTYHETIRINERGIPIDRELVHGALIAREKLRKQSDAVVKQITGEGIELIMSPLKLMIWLTTQGVDIKNAKKETLVDILKDDELPKDIRTLIEHRLVVSSASLKKFDVMDLASTDDGRVRGTIQFHAAFTGRWGGRLLQPQNLPRPTIKNLDSARQVVLDGGSVGVDVLRSLIRHSIRAPEGKELMCADWANVEGRMLAYLAGEQWKLEAFEAYDAGTGPDLYKLAYAKSFGIDVETVTDEQRAIGKVQELALGYGGGAGAIEAFAKDKFSTVEKESMKKKYRNVNSRIELFWKALESAAIKVVKGKMRDPVMVGKIAFKYGGCSLYMMLPSGRCLRYPNARVAERETPWGQMKDCLTYKKYIKGQWLTTDTFGGKLAENVVQGACACLMMEALPRFENVIMTVHDEIVCEIDEGTGDLESFEKDFSKVPAWAQGLPMSSSGWIGKCYRK